MTRARKSSPPQVAAAPAPILLTTEEVAARLRVAPQTLVIWRRTGRYGLRFIKVGRTVRYSSASINSFLAEREVGNTGEVLA